MLIFKYLPQKIFVVSSLVLGLLGLSWTPAAADLTPADLIVVFNLNVPESRQVATYYAQKRQVPLDNLVGVKVSPGEDLGRQEYDQELLPPLREKIAEFRRQRRNPAILLVYGIPLRVGGAGLNEEEQDLQALARVQVKKTTSEAWARLKELEGLLTRVKLPETPRASADGPTPPEVMKLAGELLPRAQRFLTWPRDGEARPETNLKMTKLITALTGKPPDGGAALKKEKADPFENMVPLPEPETLKAGAGLAAQARFLGERTRSSGGLLGELKFWDHLQGIYEQPKTVASVDSELAMLMVENYPRVHWLPNPLHLRFDREPAMQRLRQAVVMVNRLDGPTPEIARRLVDDALAAEKIGLQGVCYLDARGLKGDSQVGSYAWFDQHLVNFAKTMKEKSRLKVVLDQRPGLFQSGSCPRAALYCGWYSLAKYAASCTWVKGAVGYHVASAEATTLRKPGSQVWCRRMLEEGVAATLGPVGEPYLTAFPLPDEFFPLLMTGQQSLLEVYFRTVPHLSWMMTLIGDPLYRPFQKTPAWLIQASSPGDGRGPIKR
ncbi:MAG: TIGR03790 family protein [Desulfobaccales bacterium]